jgi:hypothetical protein
MSTFWPENYIFISSFCYLLGCLFSAVSPALVPTFSFFLSISFLSLFAVHVGRYTGMWNCTRGHPTPFHDYAQKTINK